MVRLRFDGQSGCYVGPRLSVSGSAVSSRIRLYTDLRLQRGIDPVDAAEDAWNAALDETSWSAGEDGVTIRPADQDETPDGRHQR